MRDLSDKDYERVLGAGSSWREVSADQALNELKAAVNRAKTATTSQSMIEAVLWYRILLEILDDRDDLGQLWQQLKRYQILPAEWSMWQRHSCHVLRK